MKAAYLTLAGYVLFSAGYYTRALQPVDLAAEKYRVLQRIETRELLAIALDCMEEDGSTRPEIRAQVAELIAEREVRP